MITVKTEILFTSEELQDKGWGSVPLPFMPLDYFGLPKDGVVLCDETLVFLTHDENYVFEEPDEFIKFMPSNRPTSFYARGQIENFGDEMTAAGFKVFTVGKHEHGNVVYTLHNPEHQSDASSWDYGFGGYLAVSQDIPNMEDAAAEYLKMYTDYVNGEVYTIVSVPLDSPDDWYSCGGFIGLDHTIECILSKDF